MKVNWLRLSEDQQNDLDERVKSPGWRLIRSSELPKVFPESLRQKIDSAVMVAAQTSTGGTYLVYSANRVDYKPQKIDIQPFGLIVHSTGPSSSGVFLDHGVGKAARNLHQTVSGRMWQEVVSGTTSCQIRPRPS